MANDNVLGTTVLRGVDGSGNQKNVRTDSSGNLQISVSVPATKPATGVQANVASSAVSGTILAANANRLGATVYNDSSQVLYLLLVTGGTASSTVYTVQVPPSGYYEVPFGYTGDLIGIWAAANGNARVTEFTA